MPPSEKTAATFNLKWMAWEQRFDFLEARGFELPEWEKHQPRI
jgi:hypothetical protein